MVSRHFRADEARRLMVDDICGDDNDIGSSGEDDEGKFSILIWQTEHSDFPSELSQGSEIIPCALDTAGNNLFDFVADSKKKS